MVVPLSSIQVGLAQLGLSCLGQTTGFPCSANLRDKGKTLVKFKLLDHTPIGQRTNLTRRTGECFTNVKLKKIISTTE